MAGRIATINGTMLKPGVSRNRRLYTPELIAKAAARMSERISDPSGLPIVMRSHHEAGDDSVRIVGRLTSIKVGEDGAARYTADLYDTTHGRDIATLVVPEKGQPPALKSVSIHGYWVGPVKTVTHDGESVTTGDDLEIDAVDFTATPGVIGATVDSATWVRPGGTSESVAGRVPISESAQATVEAVTEEAPPIRSRASVRRAVREATSPAARIHVMARAAALGHTNLIPTHWMEDGSMQETTRYSDVREYYPDGPGGNAGFCIDAYNGPTSVTIRNCSLDPAELRVVAAAAMAAIVDALQAVDPDMDGDVDVDGAPNADTDGDMGAESGATPDDDMESAPRAGQRLTAEQAARVQAAADTGRLAPGQHVTAAVIEALPQTSPAAPVGETATHQEVPAVSEPQTPAAETASTPTPIAPVIQLTQEQFTQLLAAVAPARETAAPAAVTATETAPVEDAAAKAAAKEAKEQRKAEKKALAEAAVLDRKAIADEVRTQLRDELRAELLRENGLPQRGGYRVHENDQAPDDAAALYADRANLLLGSIGIPAAPIAQ